MGIFRDVRPSQDELEELRKEKLEALEELIESMSPINIMKDAIENAEKMERERQFRASQEHFRFIAEMPKRHEEMLVRAQLEALRRFEAGDQAKAAQTQAEAFGNIDLGSNETSKKLEAAELSIDSIMNYWFRYEPKEETQAAIKKCRDEKNRIRGVLNYGVDTGKLKTRVETKEKKVDIHPNQITGKFPTELEDRHYQGRAYTRVDIVKIAYVPLNDLAQYLRSINETPPKDSPLMIKWLANWWKDAELQTKEQAKAAQPQAEEIGDTGAGSQGDTKPQINHNDMEFSGLLKVPGKVSAWFRAVDDMARAYYTEHGTLPNKDQAWAEMCKNPPKNYGITFNTEDKHKNKGCLEMPGETPRTKRNFIRRWTEYTAI